MKTYVRPMRGWWRRDPFFVRYMWREATAIGVAVYAIVLTIGVLCLAQGETAFNGWLHALQSAASIALHIALFASMVYHAKSWFDIMPKTMPMLFVGGTRVRAATITRLGYAAAALASLATVTFVWVLR